jgi:hypothetical protein
MAAFEIVIIEKGWTRERIEAADAEKAFTCPVHGRRLPPILHLSPIEAEV